MSHPGRSRNRGGQSRWSAEPTPDGTADPTPDADPAQVARSIVLRQLTMAPRSRGQLADKLAQRGTDEALAQQVLDRFEEVGLVDDAAFAELVVRSQIASRGLARRALAHELRRKGVDDETVQQALEQVADDDELATARSLVARRLASTRRLTPERRVARLAGMLARKGYSSGMALRVIRESLESEGVELEDEDDLPLD